MDDQNQTPSATFANEDRAPVTRGGVPLLNPEAEALSGDPNSLSRPVQAPMQAPRNIMATWTRMLRRADIVVIALVLVGAGVLVLTSALHKSPTQSSNASVSGKYGTQQIPLAGFVANNNGIAFGPSNVVINGPLTLNDALVISPSVQPNAPTAGQLYYDQNTNQLAYYNGTAFVPLSASGAVVQSIGGVSGQLTLGGGLSVINNQLTASSSGVSSFGGRTGGITLGGGLGMAGNTLQNTGVLNVIAGTNTTVTNDGSGNFTVNNVGAGTGTVTSGGGTNGALALFTGSQNIESSLITQSGTTITITGDLNVVTGGLSLGNALTVPNGGTGTTSLAANGVVVAAGTAALTSVTAGSPGLCFVSTGGAPTFAACPSSSGVTALNGLSGALNVANASGSGATVTIDNASTVAKGIASFNNTNFTAAAGAINTIQDINTTAAPTFGRLTLASNQATNPMLVVNNTNAGASGNLLDLQLNGSSKFSVQPSGNITTVGTVNGQTISNAASFTGSLGVAGAATLGGTLAVNGGTISSAGALNITPGGTLTAGAAGQTLALQGSSASSFAVTNGGNTTTLNFQAPTANVTYRLATAALGNYDICTTAGNCTGVGGGVTTPGGTTNRLAKFTSSQGIGDSSISDNGTTVTTTANLVVQGGAATVGIANSQSGSLTLAYGSANFSGTITQGALTTNRTYTLPDFDGTVCLSSGNCLGGGGGGANTALSNLSSVAINTSLLPGSTSIDLGSGTAPFRELYIAGTSATPGTNNFKITGASTGGTRTITLPDTSGTVCLNNSTNCGFLTGSGTAFVQNGNTLGVAAVMGTTDNFALNLITNNSTRLTIGATGNTSLTGDLAVNGGDVTSSGALNITPGGTLTAGSSGQTLTLQGSDTTTIKATNGANTTTVSFQTPTANVNYRFPTAPANTYDICTTIGNCAGSGTGVTTPGGTTGTIPVFTASQAIGDSLLSQSGGTVTVGGNFNLTSGNFYRINGTQISSANLSNDANLAKLSASQTFTGNAVAFQNASNSTNAFSIQNAVGTRILTADTAGGQIVLGLASTLDGKLLFSNVSNANTVTIVPGTPTGPRTLTLPDVSGIICTDAGNCAGAGATLQTGYNFSAGGTTPKIKVNGSLLGVDIQDADISITADLFDIRASNGGGGGLGSVMLGVGATGQLTFQNSANSTTAFRVLTQGGTRVLTLDTTNGQAVLGQGTTLDGKLVFNNSSNSNQITLTTAAASGPQTITLPNATGTVCLTIGNCTGAGSSNTLQAAYDAGATITTSNARDLSVTLNDTATDSNFLVNLQCTTACGGNGRFAVQNTGVDVFHILPNGGAALFQPTTDTTSAFNVQTSLGNNMFTIDTLNSRVGIGLGGSNLPTLTGKGIELSGALKLIGNSSVTDNYVTPGGGTVGSRINVVNADLAGNNQIIAVGVTSTSNVTARGISVFDGRTVAHQPSIGVFSPDENNIVGFSWNGSNTTASVQTTDHTGGSSTVGIVLQSGNVSGGNGSSGEVRVNSGSIAGGTGFSTGDIYVVTGDGGGTDSSTGNIFIDAGAKTGAGTNGAVNIGRLNAAAINLGRNSGGTNITTTIQGLGVVRPRSDTFGSFQVQDATGNQLLAVGGSGGAMKLELGKPSAFTGQIVFDGAGGANAITLIGQSNPGAARTITLPDETGTVCLQSSANCGFATGSGVAFVQNGNSFGATAVLGTNDANDLAIRRNTATKLTVGANDVTFASNIDLLLQGATAYISNPQGQTNGEAFGLNASVTGANGTAVGNGAAAVNNGVSIGYLAGASAGSFGGPVSIGQGANAGAWGVAIGQSSSGNGNNGVAIGNAAASAQDSVAIGMNSSAMLNGVALGYGATTGGNNRIVIGHNATATADYQMVVGSNDALIGQVVIGNGVTNAAPSGFTLQGTSGTGTDIAGASVTIAGGQSTGAGNGGNINLQISKPGSSGAGTNSLQTVATFSGANGSLTLQNAADTASAFKIVNAANGETLLTADTTARSGSGGNLIKIGNSTGTDTALTVLKLDSTTADPTTNLAALNGGLYYNSTTNKVSLVENGQVKIICNTTDLGCGTGTVNLQNAYNNSTGGSTPEIILGATRTSLDIQDRSTSNGGTLGGNLLNVRATAANDTTLGTILFDVDNTGHVGIGAATPTRTLDIATNDSNTTAPAIRLLQGGSGDATAELNNSVSGYFVGVDTSDSSQLKISSALASGAASKFGYTSSTWNNTFDGNNNNMITATLVTSGGNAGTLNSISVYVGKIGGTGQMQVGIYSNKTTGCAGGHSNCPNALVANSGNYTLTEYSWNTIPVTAAVSASTKYWLGFNVNSGATNYALANGVGSDETAFYDTTGVATPFGTWPANYSGANYSTNSSQGGSPYRIYATYTTSSSTDTFANNLFSLSSEGAATFKNSTDSNQALQVKNSSGGTILSVDTLNNDSATNLITDGGFEHGVSNWSVKDSGNGPFQRVDQHHSGHAALYIEGTNTAGGGGVKYDITLTDALQYIATFYVKSSTGDAPAATIEAGYHNGTSNTPCTQNTSTINSLGWTRIECTVTTPGSHSGTPHFYIKRTDQHTSDVFIDDVFLSSDYSSFGVNSLRNGGIDLQGVIQSDMRLQQSVNSTTALTVQNQYANTILNVDTTDPNNLVLNPSFEKDLTSGLSVFDTWSATGAGTTVSRDTSQAAVGTASLKVITTTTANAGATYLTKNTYPTQLAISTTYTLSWYAKLSSGTFTDMKAGYARDGSTWIDCIPTNQTVLTGGWTRFTCSFTTNGTSPNASAAIRFIQTAGTAHTFWIDAVRLEAGSTARSYGNGSLSLDALINSPVSLRNNSDSTAAFSIQNASNQSLFNVDSLRNNLSVFSGTSANIGAWTTTSPINGGSPAARYGATSVTANGYIYVLGGTSNSASTFANNVYYAKINADGTISGTWSSATNLPYSAYKASSFVANGYLYYIGGYDGTNTRSDVVYARINADGSLGTWQTAAAVTPGRSSSGIAYLNGYVYVIGGFNNSIFVGTTSYAKVNADGSVGNWQTATGVLPSAATIARASAVAANGYIYLMGGSSDNTPANGKTAVYYTQPNASTGDIGSNWSTSANSLPAAGGRTGATALISNGNVYYMGGIDTSSAVQTSIYSAALPAAGGDISAWSTSSSVLGAARWDASSVIVNGYMYEIGGNSSSATTTSVSTIYYATTARLQVGGSIDLVGTQNATLADSGSDQSTGSAGGSITAGNGTFMGALQVQGQATFAQSVSVNGNFSVGTILAADVARERITVGPSAGDTTGAILVLGNKTNSGDPTGVNGAMYYNSNTNTFRCYENSGWTDCLSRHKIVLGSDVANSQGTACTNSDITGLNFSVTSGNTYRWHAQIAYSAAVVTTGSEWTATTPTTSLLAMSAHQYTAGGAGVQATVFDQAVNSSDAGTCSSASSFTSGNIATIDGVAAVTANGTIQMRFASEVSGSAITAKAGSTLEWW